MKRESISLSAMILSLSFWAIFIAYEGSFSIQSIFPLIIFGCLTTVSKKNFKIKFKKNDKLLILFFISLLIACCINLFLHKEIISIEIAFGILYFFTIVIWYLSLTNKNYSSKDLQFILSSYITITTICSLIIIFKSFSGVTGKISFTNLLGTLLDENLLSAIISISPIYLFINIINKKDLISKKIIKCILFFINILAIALCGSRAALIATLLPIGFAFFLYIFQDMTVKKFIKIIVTIMIIIFTGIKIINIMPSWTFNRYFSNSYNDHSNRERIAFWKNSIEGIIDQPLFGYGTGVFHNLPQYMYISTGKRIPTGVPAHHTYLDIMVYSGFIGGGLFLLFLFSIFKKFLNKNKKMLLPIISNILIITNILGADKSVYLWNNLIILVIISMYIDNGGKYTDIL